MVSTRLNSEAASKSSGSSHTRVPTDPIFHSDERTVETSPVSTTPLSISPQSPLAFADDTAAWKSLTVEICVGAEEQEATQLDVNECHGPEEHNKVSHHSPSLDSDFGKSPEVFENGSPTPTSWDKSWAGNTDNPVSGWGGPVWCPEPIASPPKQKWRGSQLPPESKSWLHPLSFRKPAHTLSDVEYKELIDLHVLPLKTRLEDDSWLNSCLGHVRVDDERLVRLVTKGRELAQKCLWMFMDKHQPDIRRREFPGGWQQVRLEVSALMPAVPSWSLSFRGNSAQLARDALFAVVPLRHLTCHWNQHDLGWARPAPRVVDRHLKNVQKLAIHLYDEECAMEARKLRDEARQAVEDTVAEIEALEPLFDVYEWKYHHEQMFEQIKYAEGENDPDMYKYPDVILRAAEAWSRRRSSSDQAFEEDPSHETRDTEGGQPILKEDEDYASPGKKSVNEIAKNIGHRISSRRHSMPSGETVD